MKTIPQTPGGTEPSQALSNADLSGVGQLMRVDPTIMHKATFSNGLGPYAGCRAEGSASFLTSKRKALLPTPASNNLLVGAAESSLLYEVCIKDQKEGIKAMEAEPTSSSWPHSPLPRRTVDGAWLTAGGIPLLLPS